MNVTQEQQSIIDKVREKVSQLFVDSAEDVHGIGHAERVSQHASYIAETEGENVFLATLVGLLHDIGYLPIDYAEQFSQYDASKTHHELSYEMLRDWFRDERMFDVLSDNEKIELLYAVRYHWNDEACDYATAYILRDADKLDGLGEIGLERSKQFYTDKKAQLLDMRLHYEWIYHFKTDTAKRIFTEGDLMAPFERERSTILREGIKSVEL